MRNAAMAKGEKPRYNGYYRDRNEPLRDDPNRVIRFKNPLTGSVVFDDKVKGRVEWSNEELDDLVLIRSDGFPTYNFAVVVDDIDMKIGEVIRGDDHVNNTPRQINIYHALGEAVPEFAHLPMILGAGRPEAQQAPRRGRRDAVPRRRLPAARAAQLSGTPRLVARRSGNLLARGDDRAVRRRRRQQVGRRASISKSCRG